MRTILSMLLLVLTVQTAYSQKLIPVGEGWANNSVNTTVFRKNSIVTFQNYQFIAYYDINGFLLLGKRTLDSNEWETVRTPFKGNVRDAHNSISIMVDGDGYIHVSWDHHDNELRYARGKSPLSLELCDKEPMTGLNENKVTYPEFYRMPDGDLIFMYRSGFSGGGNLVLNRYSLKEKQWRQVQQNVIDGEGECNAYWQACVDNKGIIHLSWVWRDTWDVASNHDLCYARSADGGITWEKSNGEPYQGVITRKNAEYALRIPQNSELINQTSMTTDDKNNPYIASYWRSQDSDVPQFHVVYHDGKKWNDLNLDFRKTAFSLKGGGTKRIPISRPQILASNKGKRVKLMLLFRDEERDSKVSIAVCDNVKKNRWKIKDLTTQSVGSWEPSYDTELWRDKSIIHLFVQRNEQVDGEGRADVGEEKVYVLEVQK